jgi:hypothetical protein
MTRASTRSRRNQPRTVSIGTPSWWATRRAPAPPTNDRQALPTTATASRRRTRTSAGRTTCVTPQSTQRTRPGRKSAVPKPRTVRRRAWPHLRSRPGQTGHDPGTDATRSSTDSSGRSTIVMTGHLSHRRRSAGRCPRTHVDRVGRGGGGQRPTSHVRRQASPAPRAPAALSRSGRHSGELVSRTTIRRRIVELSRPRHAGVPSTTTPKALPGSPRGFLDHDAPPGLTGPSRLPLRAACGRP